HTGQPIEAIEKETERDRYFSAQEAKDFGIVDDVLLKLAEEKKK
ncbi:MAG: ATP-dependent Clp protease proteolytic subunit, partial [Acidobacteria bacterium]|nr:ATP-dependent Clp protease proteolytic subunit [Acidobacteriota bacterium]